MSSCRLRKVACPDCGYVIRVTRSWMTHGLPICPCGQTMRPDTPADLAFIGLINAENVSQAAWNEICRENGWTIIRNQGQEASALNRGGKPTIIMDDHAGAAHCAYAGCGRWIKDGSDRCSAGHAQHKDAAPVENMPF